MASLDIVQALFLSSILVIGLARIFRRYVLIPRYMIDADLPKLGTPRCDNKILGQAVVCGGSVAGLLAAAVCSDHFESVRVVEPEASTHDERGIELPANYERRFDDSGVPVPVTPRKRIMQYYAYHNAKSIPFEPVFHPTSYTALQHLFPNLQAELDYLHIKPTVMDRRNAQFPADPYRKAFENDDITSGAPLTLSISRETWEILVRRCVKNSRSNIKFVTGTVVGVRATLDARNKRLEKVLIRTDASGEVDEVEARLVVDAAGTAQMGFHRWLKSAGFALPARLRHEYKPNRQVVNAIFTVPTHLHDLWPVPWGFKPGGLTFGISGEARSFWAASTHPSLLYLFSVIVGMSCNNWPIRPHSASEMVATFCDLKDYRDGRVPPWVLDTLKFLEDHEVECEPFWSDYSHRSFSWVRYHKAEIDSLPKNFVAVGDAVMRLNPSAGQGCTKAVYDAVTLGACLGSVSFDKDKADLPENFSRKFFQKQAPRIEHMWTPLKDMDYRAPECVPVDGESLEDGPWRRRFAQEVAKLCKKHKDPPYPLRTHLPSPNPLLANMKGSDILLVLIAIVLPPLAAFMITGCGCDLLINIILGHIHAFWLIYKKMQAEKMYGVGGYTYAGSGRFTGGGVGAAPIAPQPGYGATNY
ncbi:hypothetical protein FRB97_004705 [Tulasnella sp. 331]|nr:hypothetical protein FRB97_004705 [Tulasnella sp. 331]